MHKFDYGLRYKDATPIGPGPFVREQPISTNREPERWASITTSFDSAPMGQDVAFALLACVFGLHHHYCSRNKVRWHKPILDALSTPSNPQVRTHGAKAPGLRTKSHVHTTSTVAASQR